MEDEHVQISLSKYDRYLKDLKRIEEFNNLNEALAEKTYKYNICSRENELLKHQLKELTSVSVIVSTRDSFSRISSQYFELFGNSDNKVLRLIFEKEKQLEVREDKVKSQDISNVPKWIRRIFNG